MKTTMQTRPKEKQTRNIFKKYFEIIPSLKRYVMYINSFFLESEPDEVNLVLTKYIVL